MTLLVAAAPGNETFADRLAEELDDAARLEVEFHTFPDDETMVRVAGECKDATVIVVDTLDRPNPKLLPLALLVGALRDRGAAHVPLVAPYLAYMRQDKAFEPGQGISAHHFARLVSSFTDALVTVDPHLHRIVRLEDVYSVPCVNVHAARAIATWVEAEVDRPVFIGPDAESKQWVSDVASRIDAPYVALKKVRSGDRDVSVSPPELGEHADRTPVIVDDIISTARTMIDTVRHLTDDTDIAPLCIGVHAVFAGEAHDELLRAGAARIVTTNTIPHPTNAIDVAPLVASAFDQVFVQRMS